MPQVRIRNAAKMPAAQETRPVAEAGASKPDPAPFRLALERLGVEAGRALHVGDTPATDGDGASGAGLDVRIVHRGPSPPPGAVAALTEIPALL